MPPEMTTVPITRATSTAMTFFSMADFSRSLFRCDLADTDRLGFQPRRQGTGSQDADDLIDLGQGKVAGYLASIADHCHEPRGRHHPAIKDNGQVPLDAL